MAKSFPSWLQKLPRLYSSLKTKDNSSTSEASLDKRNAIFWNEACGTNLARYLGIKRITATNLKRFDQAYWDYYPYLKSYLFLNSIHNKKILEIGLGYGTSGQLLSSAGADYYGIDVASQPAKLMSRRLKLLGKKIEGRIQVGSVLNLPYKTNSFDFVYAIGVLHHTGNLARSFTEVYRVLKPKGTAVIMVYKRFSLRQISALWHYFGYFFATNHPISFSQYRNSLYDADTSGQIAPYIDYLSKKQLEKLLYKFSNYKITTQNCYPIISSVFKIEINIPREKLLNNVARLIGLEFYIVAQK